LTRKILLADDSVTAQNMGRKILADAGYDVVTVNNGSAALKRIAEIKPDLIVLDVYMPGYSGLEVCLRLKEAEETAGIPVLLTVGKLEPFKPEEARRAGADAHIVKPFEASELLSAIARLEELAAAQPSGGARGGAVDLGAGRFRPEGSGRKAESNSGSDTSWKSRLGFPSKKKKKEETEETETAAAGSFHDFREGKRKGAVGASAEKRTPVQEPVADPDIPRDITPEELDALSALAAKLDGTSAAVEEVGAQADETPRETSLKTAPETSPETSPETRVDSVSRPAELAEASAAEQKRDEHAGVETPVAVVEAALAEAPAAEVKEFAVEGRSEIEIRAQHLAPTTEVAAIAERAPVEVEQSGVEPAATQAAASPLAEKQLQETQATENRPSEKPAAAVETVNAAQFAEEPACVDRSDEPMFASGASAVGPTAKEPAPSDDELVQALRLLTPGGWNADASTVPTHGTLVAAGHLLAEEAARIAAESPQWMAEAVALSPEEAAISLEAEMFGTFSAKPATAAGDAMEAAGIPGVSAMAAAVENTLAKAALAAGANILPEPGPEPSEEPVCGTTLAATAVVAAEEHRDASGDGTGEESTDKDAIAEANHSDLTQTSTDAGSSAANMEVAAAAESAERGADEALKTMAAAAAAAGGSSAPDASTIASIVDRVLADLRPKLVEEIARKLAGK
jgi:CheY-like chemotaxis protein